MTSSYHLERTAGSMLLNLKKKSDPAQGDTGGIAMKKKGRRKGWGKKLVALVLVCAIAGGGAWYFLGGDQNAAAAANTAYTTAEVTRRTITSTITGSGTLQAADSYSVTTLLEGTILTADFEEGDQVEEGTVLYTIDSSDASSSLEQSQISVNQAQRNYENALESLEDLDITATVSGRVLSLDVEVGDEVNAGQTVATLRNSAVMELTVPFPADDAASFYVGQTATVTLDSTFETLTGTVSKIAGNTEVLTGNVIVRDVTLQVSNPGGLSTTQSASAAVGGVGSSSASTFAYADEATVTASVSGTVSAISFQEGDWVEKDQVLVSLTSDSVDDQIQSASESLRNAELSYDKQTEQLDDYTITAPITGTIVDKYYNAGEISESNQRGPDRVGDRRRRGGPDLHRCGHQGQRGGYLQRQRHHLPRHHPHRRHRRSPPRYERGRHHRAGERPGRAGHPRRRPQPRRHRSGHHRLPQRRQRRLPDLRGPGAPGGCREH